MLLSGIVPPLFSDSEIQQLLEFCTEYKPKIWVGKAFHMLWPNAGVTSALTLYLFIYIIPYELIEAEGILNNKRKINQISSETK